MDFASLVLVIIDSNGRIYPLSISADANHLAVFKRFITTYPADMFQIKNYLEENKDNISKLSGMSIAKFISDSGNIIFFHNDVHDYSNKAKNATLMLPNSLTKIQRNTLRQLLPSMASSCNIPYGISSNENGYTYLERSTINNIINYGQNVSLGLKNNVLSNYALIIIDEDGVVHSIDRSRKYETHFDAYADSDEIISKLLSKYEGKFTASSGYQLAEFVCANRMVVIWSADINSLSYEIISLPEILSNDQCLRLQELLHDPLKEENNEMPYYVTTSKYLKRDSLKIVTKDISNGDSYMDAYITIHDFIQKSKAINNLGEVISQDLSVSESIDTTRR